MITYKTYAQSSITIGVYVISKKYKYIGIQFSNEVQCSTNTN